MASIYSVSLVQKQGLTGAEVVPEDPANVYVVRQVSVYWNNFSASAAFRLIGELSQTVLFNQFTITDGNPWWDWEGRHVFEGEFAVASSGDPMDVTVSGYLLSRP
jgi:hypothetical protein